MVEGVIWKVILAINLISFITMGVDKNRAINDKWRVSERNLWLLAIIGGGIGSTLGMIVFRHKTRRTAFRYGFSFIMIVQIMLYLL